MGLEGSTGEGGVVWDHVKVNGWISAGAQETDVAAAEAIYADILQEIFDHNAFIWGYQSVEFHVEGAWMEGYVFNPMKDEYFYHYYKVVI
jgi:ABC-type transport system substrate-binding protein